MPIQDRDWYRERHQGNSNSRRGVGHRPGQRNSGGGNSCRVVLILALVVAVLGAAFFSPLGERIDNEAFQELRGEAREAVASVTEGIGDSPGQDGNASDGPARSTPTPRHNCHTQTAITDAQGEYSSSNLRVVEIEIEASSAALTRIRGEIIGRCRGIWRLANDTEEFDTFAIYRYPEPTSGNCLPQCPSESPIGSVLPVDNWILEQGDVMAPVYTLSSSSFIIEFRRDSAWGLPYRLGVWGWNVESRTPGLLADIVVR